MDAVQRQCLRELAALRAQLDESEGARALLSLKVEELTSRLRESTAELESRLELYNEAAERAEKAEALVESGRIAVLSREMQIHELTQRVRALEMEVRKEEHARSHWEREAIAAKDEATRAERAARQARETESDKAAEVAGWKKQLRAANKSVSELKEQLASSQAREQRLVEEVAKAEEDSDDKERRWKSQVAKKEIALRALQAELVSQRDRQQLLEEREQELTRREAESKSGEAALNLERRAELLASREHLQRVSSDLQKAKLTEMLAQRELCRLREELLLSDSQRRTEQRRHAQKLKGKEKEMAFIWQRYVEAVASRRTLHPPVSTDTSGLFHK